MTGPVILLIVAIVLLISALGCLVVAIIIGLAVHADLKS